MVSSILTTQAIRPTISVSSGQSASMLLCAQTTNKRSPSIAISKAASERGLATSKEDDVLGMTVMPLSATKGKTTDSGILAICSSSSRSKSSASVSTLPLEP